MITALAFAPREDIPEYCDDLRQFLLEAYPESLELLNYFRDTYVGSQFLSPRFPSHLWNFHARVLNKQARTNNLVKRFNHGLNTRVACHHPTISRLVHLFKDEQAKCDKGMHNHYVGCPPPRKAKLYKLIDARRNISPMKKNHVGRLRKQPIRAAEPKQKRARIEDLVTQEC